MDESTHCWRGTVAYLSQQESTMKLLSLHDLRIYCR